MNNAQSNQDPLIGNATERQTPWGGTEFKIGISPEGMRVMNQSSYGGWGNAILFKSKAGKWILKLDTYKSKQSQQQPIQSQQTPQYAHRYDNPELQPRAQAQQRQSLGAVSQAVASNMRPPAPALNHSSERTFDDHGEEIPF